MDLIKNNVRVGTHHVRVVDETLWVEGRRGGKGPWYNVVVYSLLVQFVASTKIVRQTVI